MNQPPVPPAFSFARPIHYRRSRKLKKIFGFADSQIDRRLASEYAPLVIGQFRRLEKPTNPPPLWSDIERTIADIEAHQPQQDATVPREGIEKDPDSGPICVSWECIYQIEYAIVTFEPPADLAERAAILKQEYLELASAPEREAFLGRHSNGKLPEKEPELRAVALRLLEEVHWRYVGLAAFNDTVDQIMRNVVTVSGLGLLALLGLACGAAGPGFNGRLLWLLAASGLVGGLVSTLQRLQSARFESNLDLDSASLGQGKFSVNLSPFLGAIFALAIGCIAASGLVEIKAAGESLLPTLRFEFFVGSGSHALLDFQVAKLLVWGFAAGFAERLVPDRLSKLIEAAK